MAYYTDANNVVYWYADDGSQTAQMQPNLTAITDAQAQAILNPPLTPAQIRTQFTEAAQNLLDQTAQTQGYDDMLSLISYVDSTNATFKAQALVGSAWRDAVWTEGYSILAQFQAGQIAQPTLAAFLAMLPQIQWPT